MVLSIFVILQAVVVVAALSLDAFAASFAYGANRIKMPAMSVQIINAVCSSVLGLSLIAGEFARAYIPPHLTSSICFAILFILGVLKLMDSVVKSIIRRHGDLDKQIKFSMLSLKFIVSIYADPEVADADHSRNISPAEAVSIALALSLDGLAVGFGAAIGSINPLAIFLSSLLITAPTVMLGCYAGNKIARAMTFDMSWPGGIVLIIMAILRLRG